jgi:hypothetical protein
MTNDNVNDIINIYIYEINNKQKNIIFYLDTK